MLIGYARVSTDDQKLDLQRDALASCGCERVFEDKASGARAERPGLNQALEQLRAGDTLVVWRLDRLGRSLKDLIIHAETLREQIVGLKSLQESIDTTSSGGQLIFHMFAALAEFERSLVRERTQAGLEAARARGRKGGRRKLLNEKNRALYYPHSSPRCFWIFLVIQILKCPRNLSVGKDCSRNSSGAPKNQWRCLSMKHMTFTVIH